MVAKHKVGKDGEKKGLTASFVTGAIALVFLIVGYQIALFLNRAAISKILSDKNSPDTVFVTAPAGESVTKEDRARPGSGSDKTQTVIASKARGYRISQETGQRKEPQKNSGTGQSRKAESFRFDPNTVSVKDLQRLGFSEKQALAIDNYRQKGGRFRRKSDFAKSFVVADSVYRRLEPYIDIPLVNLNRADSAALDALPGIGGYFASAIIRYREKLGGFSYKEQLLDIYRFDKEKYDVLQDLVTVGDFSDIKPLRLWTMPEDSLKLHPYIGTYAAHGIIIFRENMPVESWSVETLAAEGILKKEMAEKLAGCVIAPPTESQ